MQQRPADPPPPQRGAHAAGVVRSAGPCLKRGPVWDIPACILVAFSGAQASLPASLSPSRQHRHPCLHSCRLLRSAGIPACILVAFSGAQASLPAFLSPSQERRHPCLQFLSPSRERRHPCPHSCWLLRSAGIPACILVAFSGAQASLPAFLSPSRPEGALSACFNRAVC